MWHFQNEPSTSDYVAGMSSPETVISLPLDPDINEDSQDTVSNTGTEVNLIEGQFEFTQPKPVAGPSNVRVKTCKGKCSGKNSCNIHVPAQTSMKKINHITSTGSAALNVLDIDLVNNLMDNGKFCTSL